MVPKKLGVKSAKELNGATVCVQPGTTTELNLADYFRANKMNFKPVVIEKLDEVVAAFFRAAATSHDRPFRLWPAIRTGRDAEPGRPRHPARDASRRSRSGRRCATATTSGADIVRWVVYALIEAEE